MSKTHIHGADAYEPAHAPVMTTERAMSAAELMRFAAVRECCLVAVDRSGREPELAAVAWQCADRLAEIPIPADPRDAEIAAYRSALTEIARATHTASGFLDVNRATVWRVNDIARAALAQSGTPS